MLRLARHVILTVLFVLIAGCSGGGCSSGCSCAGVTPLAEGFPVGARIENVASIRLTDQGIGFLEQNLGAIAGLALGDGGGQLSFEIPTLSQGLVIASAEICPNGPNPNANPPECIAEIDLANAQLQVTPSNPHNVVISGPLPIRIQRLPIKVTWLGFLEDNLDIVLNGPGTCPGDNKPYKNVNINEVNVSIEIDGDSTHARFGYSRVRIGNVDIDEDDVLDGIEYCDQNGVTGAILDALDGFLIGFIEDALVGTVGESLEDALCQPANPELNPPCPTGTVNVDGVCRYGPNGDDECASVILGLDGNIDLGGLLSSFSPGTKGAFDFLFASGGHSLRTDGSGHHWGDMNPVNQGISLGFYGGTEPTPISGCVTPVNLPLPDGIPVPDELTQNSIPNWPMNLTGPHFGLALSERFLNYMFTQLYNSGALCLGITADALGGAVPLTTSLIGVGLGAPSLNELGRQKQPSEMAIVLRPGAPPNVEIGNGTDIATDPLLRIRMDQLAFDFYVWSLDRFVRVFTATMDLDVPMNLMVSDEGLTPVIEELGVSNAVVTNSALLREDPVAIAAALQDLLGSLVGSALGDALPPINVNDQLSGLGLTLDIPPSVDGGGSPGLRKLTKDQDDFLGIFANLGLAPTMMAQMSQPLPDQPQADTTAELVSLDVDPEGLHLDTWTADNGPKVRLHLGSNLDDGQHEIEWQYQLDGGAWHTFKRDRWLDIEDAWLRTQGKHSIKVRSRIVGQPYSLDKEPAEVTFFIDDAAPRVRLIQDEDGFVRIDVKDAVSGNHKVQVRVRYGTYDGDETAWSEWSEWMPADEIAALQPEADEIEVEAADEEGNIGVAQSALIRGVGDAGDGCQCTVDSRPHDQPPGAWALAGLLGLGMAWRRRRTGRDDDGGSAARRKALGDREAKADRKAKAKRIARHTISAIGFVAIGGLTGCNCGDDTSKPPSGKIGCAARGDCTLLEPGLIGAYTSAAVAPDGTVWVAGYLEANWLDDYSWGDLVVGRLVDGVVDWNVIDGVPAEEVDTELYDPDGFRGGVTDAGDDVGLWTSIAVDGAGNPAVAYYDVTNKALKYASYDGTSWQTAQVQQATAGELGKYAEMMIVNNQPTIAYLFIEPGEGNLISSGVRLARGSAVGAGAAAWTFEDIAVATDAPCSAGLCPSGTECVVDGRVCAPTSGDCGECADDCVLIDGQPSCEAVVSSSATVGYPGGNGLYISMDLAPDGSIGLAWYDRVHGNVVAATSAGGAWATVVVDGEDAMGNNTGDKGIGCSLDIDDAGNFHIAYVDGLDEAVNYAMVQGGTTPVANELVDSGLGDGDGVHLVGDDSSIYVTPGGEVRISYQDATNGTLKLAVGVPNGNAHDWTTTVAQQDGFAGAFSVQLDVGGALQVLNWWRVATPSALGDVRVVQP
jgi:MYXO-CTERM domain-containing protein